MPRECCKARPGPAMDQKSWWPIKAIKEGRFSPGKSFSGVIAIELKMVFSEFVSGRWTGSQCGAERLAPKL